MKRILSIVLVLLWSCVAFASTADDISREANKLIRTAEKEFFAGKADAALISLQAAQIKLDTLKGEDPSHRSLKSLQHKYDRLYERVEKKLGQNTQQVNQTATQAAPPKGGDELSSGAKSNLKAARKELDSARKELAKAEMNLQAKKFNMVKSQAANTADMLDAAQQRLDRVVNNNKANPNHPEVAAAHADLSELRSRFDSFTEKAKGAEAGAEQATAEAAGKAKQLNQQWIPKMAPFYQGGTPDYLQYPGSYNQQALDQQEKLYNEAQTLLQEVQSTVPAAERTPELERSIKELTFILGVYDDQKKADGRNRLQPIDTELTRWEQRFKQNQGWNEDSDQAPFIVKARDLDYQKKQIEQLKATYPQESTAFTQRFNALEKENAAWVVKKKKWMERPRPFPVAKMQSGKLEKEVLNLLEDRGIKVKEFVITDKDWWVSHGEYRYMAGAFLSKDKDGKYWSTVTFRQIQTLAGYNPTEIWEMSDIKIRLP